MPKVGAGGTDAKHRAEYAIGAACMQDLMGNCSFDDVARYDDVELLVGRRDGIVCQYPSCIGQCKGGNPRGGVVSDARPGAGVGALDDT